MPGWGFGVTVPTSTKPKPRAPRPSPSRRPASATCVPRLRCSWAGSKKVYTADSAFAVTSVTATATWVRPYEAQPHTIARERQFMEEMLAARIKRGQAFRRDLASGIELRHFGAADIGVADQRQKVFNKGRFKKPKPLFYLNKPFWA